MFTLGSNPLFADSWERQILSENASVLARLDAFSGVLSLSIFPAVTKDADHLGKRETAGVYFEIAAKIAEKVNGTIIQHSNVGICRAEIDNMERLLGTYPAMPMSFSRICPGFRQTLLGD